ncbi:MAG: orotidine-5'-phosphate decarboxylase [Firmicutes bacterium]|nr:orotidine-5'-phosphate decarboxylase [Bacillota bacterium]
MNEVIIACDFKNKNDLEQFLEKFGTEKPFLKIGMELFYKEGPHYVKELKERGYKIFLDLKLHDIPTTVYKAMKNLVLLDVDITNIHAAGGIQMMKMAKLAVDESKSKMKLIAVTQLTSIDEDTMKKELLIKSSMEDTVLHYGLNAKKANLDGVVCSAYEATIMKEIGLISVTPGIRFAENEKDDQARVCTPQMAKEFGSTYIVVGRAITASENPVQAYLKSVKEFC